MANQKLKSLLKKAQSGSKTPKYKRVFVSSNGTEYRFRPLSTALMDSKEIPFVKVRMHGGYKHPNYDGAFTSNFTCLGKDCPMCKDVRELKNVEYKNSVPRNMRNAWKKDRAQYALYWGVNREDGELTVFFVPDTGRFKKVKDDNGKEKWEQTNTTCQEKLFEKLLNATENDLDPFDYKEGNDIIIKSKKVDGVVHWDISVDPEKNSVDEPSLKRLEVMPKLGDLYKKYTKEELEYIVKGKPYNKDLSKQKASEEKSSTEEKVEDLSNEELSQDDSMTEDEAALLGGEDFGEVNLDEDDEYSSQLSDQLRDILNKED